MPDRTDERIRALIVELAEQAPAAPTFQELEHWATTTEARPRRRRAMMVGAIAIASVALVVGVVLARSDERSGRVRVEEPTTTAPTTTAPTTIAPTTIAPTANFPGFLPARGWQTVTRPSASSATAANIPFGPDSLKGSVPWDTVERLEDGDIVLFAMVYPMGNTAVDANFPKRELPLSLDDAVSDINFEGQPAHIYADRIGAQVNGWNIDVLIFYGGGDRTAVPSVRRAPSAETRAAAQEQLARLVVPARG
jgi:hypothetical protein